MGRQVAANDLRRRKLVEPEARELKLGTHPINEVMSPIHDRIGDNTIAQASPKPMLWGLF